MSRCDREWTRDDLTALRECVDVWRYRNEPAPSQSAVQRVARIASDVEKSLQTEVLHADRH